MLQGCVEQGVGFFVGYIALTIILLPISLLNGWWWKKRGGSFSDAFQMSIFTFPLFVTVVLAVLSLNPSSNPSRRRKN